MIQDNINNIRAWGEDKQLIGPNAKATKHTQYNKLCEEVNELRHELNSDDNEAASMELGDCVVVLIQIAEHIGISFEECVARTFQKISNRTGRTIDGCFVKDK